MKYNPPLFLSLISLAPLRYWLAVTLIGISVTAFGAEKSKQNKQNRPAVAEPSAEEAARQMSDPRM